VVPRACLDAVVRRKIPSPYRDSNPPSIQPVDQRYTKNNFGISTKRKGEGTNNIHEYDGETNYDTQMFKILNWFITL
jgi:hypothetical protein